MSYEVISALVLFGIGVVWAIVLGTWREHFSVNGMTGPAETKASKFSVSFVVPARNAAGTLVPLLQDLHAQCIPKELTEVLVVDDGSEDGTVPVATGMQRTWPQLKVLSNTGEGKKAAITTGVSHASGELIVLTDADARFGPDRTALIVDKMEADGLDLLLLPVHTKAGRGALGRIQEEEQCGLLGVAAGEALSGRPFLANGANMAFRREAFAAVGGYKGDRFASGDDVFLVQRMALAGKRIGFLLDQRAIVTVEAELGLLAFVQQRLRWAGKMRGTKGAGAWFGMLGLMLPLLLLWRTMQVDAAALVEGYGPESFALLTFAWLLWIVPVLTLVGQVRRFLGLKGSWPISALSYVAFCIYAPLIAVAALFVRPRWKGRRIR